MRFRIAEVERVDDHANVRGVLARHAHMRDFDQFERRLVHGPLEALVAVPIAIRFLDHDAAFEQQPIQYLVDVELRVFCVGHAERDVFEIAKKRHVGDFGLCSHALLRFNLAR